MTNTRVRRLVAVVAVALATLAASLALTAPVAGQSGGFGDVSDNAYYSLPVATLAGRGVFGDTLCDEGFCPGESIDRKTMAVWTVRVLDGQDPQAVTQTKFDDVDAASFYAPFIERMAELGITRGCGDGSEFCPDRNVTRAQMATFLSRAYSLPEGPDPTFSDVPDDAWYANDVARLAASSITVGCGDGTRFCPSRDTTRVQMATFLYRADTVANHTRDEGLATPAGLNTAMDGGGVIAAGGFHSCGLRVDRTIVCWGANVSCGDAGDNFIDCRRANGNGQSDAPTGEFVAVFVGHLHSCGLRTDQTLRCWRWNANGQSETPAGKFIAVTAGAGHSCGVRTDQTITCWGYNGQGRAEAPTGEFIAVSAGHHHSCGLETDKTVTCWGSNSFGGNYYVGQSVASAGQYAPDYQPKNTTDPSEATPVTLNTAMDGGGVITAGWFHSCVIRTNKTVTCWGSNDKGQADAPNGLFTAVSAGGAHSCGLRTDQTITCWGDNTDGQLNAPSGRFGP